MSDNSIPQVRLIAADLRSIADKLDTVDADSLGSNRWWIGLSIQPHDDPDTDEARIRIIDTVGAAVVGTPGSLQRMSNGTFHHDAKGHVGTVAFAMYTSVAAPELAQLRAELAEAKAQLAASTEVQS